MNRVKSAAALVLLASLAAACPAERRAKLAPESLHSERLGFETIASAEQLGDWWLNESGPRLVSGCWQSADGLQVLLALRRPVQIAGSASNAVLVSRAPLFQSRGLMIPGRIEAADFAAATVSTLTAQPDGSSLRSSFSLAEADGGDAGANADSAQPAVTAGDASDSGDQPADSTPTLTASDSGDSTIRWTYRQPESAVPGSGRELASNRLGELRCQTEIDGQRMHATTGSLPFTQLIAYSEMRSALLAAPGAGILLVDFNSQPPSLRWVLRDSGESGIFLQSSGFRVVTLDSTGIRHIGGIELASLSERLAVGQQLSASQTKRLKPLVEALGWDWKTTQLSPLPRARGMLELLDSAEIDSATAELRWDPKEQAARRLLIVRKPRPLDEQLRQAVTEEQHKTVKQLLALLGWPKAELVKPLVPVTEADQQGESVLRFQLDPASSAGELQLWLTAEAAIWELRQPVSAAPIEAVK